MDNLAATKLKSQFICSYYIGQKTQYLKIRSALEKGRKANRLRSLKQAIQFPYIAPNTKFNYRWLVFDIDDAKDSLSKIYDKGLPIPNFIVYNPENGHQHIWYGLNKPVFWQKEFSTSKAKKYCKKIYQTLAKSLESDETFNQTLVKNPFHKKWRTIIFREELYELSDIASHLDINWNEPKPRPKKSKFENLDVFDETVEFAGSAVGFRNSDLFEFCRHRAYAYRRKTNCSEKELIEFTNNVIADCNKKNQYPLREKECQQIAQSIGVWTYANISPLKTKTVEYDDVDRARSLRTRRKNASLKLQKVEKILKKNPTMSNRAISRKLGKGFSTNTVNKMVKKIIDQRQEKIAQARQSRAEVVQLPPIRNIGERFVNQVVEPVRALSPGGQLVDLRL